MFYNENCIMRKLALSISTLCYFFSQSGLGSERESALTESSEVPTEDT